MEHEKRQRKLPVIMKSIIRYLGLYLDDLLLIGAGVCLVIAAREAFGRPAAFAAAGVCLAAYALVIARARGGGRR